MINSNICIEKKCNNKLTVVTLNDIDLFFSYSSLIGFNFNRTTFLNEYYLNFSHTTNKHISYIKRNNYKVYIIKNDIFLKLQLNLLNKDYLEKILNLEIKKIDEYNTIKRFQEQNNKTVTKNFFEQTISNTNGLSKNIKLINIDYNIKPLKTIIYDKYNFKTNLNNNFSLIKKYSRKTGGLIKISIEI